MIDEHTQREREREREELEKDYLVMVFNTNAYCHLSLSSLTNCSYDGRWWTYIVVDSRIKNILPLNLNRMQVS